MAKYLPEMKRLMEKRLSRMSARAAVSSFQYDLHFLVVLLPNRCLVFCLFVCARCAVVLFLLIG